MLVTWNRRDTRHENANFNGENSLPQSGGHKFNAVWVPLLSLLLSVLPAAAQLRFTMQPTDRFLSPGQTISFYSAVSGVGPFSFQWLCNGAVFTGATNATLVVTNAQPP